MKDMCSLFPDSADIPERFLPPAASVRAGYLIDGCILDWDGERQCIESPIELGGGETCQLGSCPVLDEAAGRAAVEAVTKAYDRGMGCWPTMKAADRIACVERFMLHMIEKRDEIVRLMMWEICKPYAECCSEFDRTVEYVDDTIAALKLLNQDSSRYVVDSGICAQVRRAPLGPTLCMGPYNFPLNETFATLIPALLMGNPVILKPPRLGKLLFVPLMEGLRDCFPPGVVNFVFGSNQLAQFILESGAINVFAFIGSSEAANALRLSHPNPNRLRCILGLGAKNAAVITKSADMDLAVPEAVSGSLAFSGQRCTALKILFVHEDVVDEFIERFSQELKSLSLGMPWSDGVRITPLPEPGKAEYLTGLVEDAREHGAEVVNQDGGLAEQSLFHPTVLYPVNSDMRIYHEEQFGPVVPIVPFKDVETPLRGIAESRYGQQMSLFSDDSDEVVRLVDLMVNQVCRVNVNCLCQRGPDSLPFTGRKDSAEGTLSVDDALRCFSIRSLVAAKTSERNKELLVDIAREQF